MLKRFSACVISAGLFGSATAATTPTFTLLPEGFLASSISGDGSRIGGSAIAPGLGRVPATLRRSELVFDLLPQLPPPSGTISTGVDVVVALSFDGGHIGGVSLTRPFIGALDQDGSLTPMGLAEPDLLPAERSGRVTALSADGSIAVGYRDTFDPFEDAPGLSYLQSFVTRGVDGGASEYLVIPGSDLHGATGLSGDGRSAVGFATFLLDPVRRTEETVGYWADLSSPSNPVVIVEVPDEVVTATPTWLRGDEQKRSFLADLSADGLTATASRQVGDGGIFGSDRFESFVFRPGQVGDSDDVWISLGFLPQVNPILPRQERDYSTGSFDISADGSIVVGVATNDESPSGHAVIWDETNGLRKVADVLADLGLNEQLENWRLESALAISDDGMTIIGEGLLFTPQGDGSSTGQRRYWVATLPEPATVLPAVMFGGVLRRRR